MGLPQVKLFVAEINRIDRQHAARQAYYTALAKSAQQGDRKAQEALNRAMVD